MVIILTALCLQTRAQSLGDPIVHITFGSGTARYGGSLPADSGSTTYNYVSSTPNDGYYTITNTTAGMHTTWWTTTDHTGDPGGYMMVVNASYDKGLFYTRKVLALCGTTQYQFGAYIKNLINDNELMPNIIFSVETTKGVVLGADTTGLLKVQNNWIPFNFTFTTPANADTIVLKMINNAPGGVGNDLAIDDITFRPYGNPVAVTFDQSQTAQTFCAGQSYPVTINTTTSLAPGYQQKLQMRVNNTWVDQGTATTAPTFTINTSPIAGVYEYRVVSAMAANVSSSNCVVASNNLTITVSPLPVAAFSAPDTSCFGNTVFFIDKSTGTSTIKKWLWDFGDGKTDTVQNPSHAYAQPGSYPVSLTVVNANGCTSATTSKTIHISAPPVAGFIISKPDCVNQAITLTDQSTATEGAIKTWLWDYGDGITESKSNNAPFQHIYASTGTYTITLVVTGTSGGCSARRVDSVKISPLPVVNFGLPAVCLADSYAKFIDSTTIADNSNNSFTYLWNFGDQNANASRPNTSTDRNPLHQYTAVGQYTVTLTVISNASCSVTRTKNFTVNGSNPQASFTVDTTLLCSNKEVVVTNTSTVSPGNISKLKIYFDASDTTISVTDYNTYVGKTYRHKYPTFQGPPYKNVNLYLVAYSGGLCSTPSQPQTIRLRATPSITFVAIPALCQSTGKIQLTATPTGGIYSGTGVSPQGVFDPNLSGPGIFTIQYTYAATNGCADTVSQQVTVNTSPTVKAGPALTILEGSSAVLQANAPGAVTYQWTPGRGLSSTTQLNPTVTPTITTLYKLTVTNSQGCTATDSVLITVLKTPLIPNTFTPNGDSINDTWDVKYLSDYPNCTVSVFNRAGQVVYKSIGYGIQWDGRYNGVDLPVGTYYYIIDTKTARGTLSGSVNIIR